MITKEMTPAQIRQSGMEALARELGPVGMVRFLQQFENGAGDYSKQRHEWLDGFDVEALAAQAAAKPQRK